MVLFLIIEACSFFPVLLNHFLGNPPDFLSFLLILAKEVEIVVGMEILEAALAEIDRFLL